MQQFFGMTPWVRKPLEQLLDGVPERIQRFTKPACVGLMQRKVALEDVSFGVTLPQRLESAAPFVAQPTFQRCDYRLVRGVQRLEMRFGNVGVETDPVLLVAITFLDFENAAGPDGSMEGLPKRATLWINALHHHWRIANGYESSTLEHVHQGQRAFCLAGCGGGAGKQRTVDRSNQCDFIPDLEYLLDIQRRKTEKALGPGVVVIEAAHEVADDGFDVPRR
ncbi:hypothetical protein PS663_05756 [Pseudomonas fluorescens]|nr:hypothetical protein PS663_05756 [Pseudomonas fluorescens]